MTVEDKASTSRRRTALSFFFRGFLIRLLYGALGVPFVTLMALVWQNFFGKEFPLGGLLLGVVMCLLVCVAGGVLDAATGKKRKIRLFHGPDSGRELNSRSVL
jgi:hypothetical protein